MVCWVAKFSTSTFSNIQPAPKPLLSCSMRKRVNWPNSSASNLKSSFCPRSNKLTNFFVSGRRPVSPLLPYTVMKTLASVPACETSAVYTYTTYCTGWRSTEQRKKIKISCDPCSVETNKDTRQTGWSLSNSVYINPTNKDTKQTDCRSNSVYTNLTNKDLHQPHPTCTWSQDSRLKFLDDT